MSGIHAQAGGRVKIDDILVRHIVLNSIRAVRVKHGKKYGEIVICADGRNYWRKEINPFYKGQRAGARKKSKLDFTSIFKSFDVVKKELIEVFPYKYIEANRAEADDVIGVLARKYSSLENPCLIWSADHDFRQLHQYPGVSQISPMTKKEVFRDELSPKQYIMSHTISGDAGDNVTNLFSDTDTFMTEGKRQKSVSKKKLAEWVKLTPEEFCAETGVTMERFRLNERLVDLSKTPQDIVDDIVSQYEKEQKPVIGGIGNKILRYFMNNNMKVMTDSLNDFVFKVKQPTQEEKGNLAAFF